jgi:hypothetical protein
MATLNGDIAENYANEAVAEGAGGPQIEGAHVIEEGALAFASTLGESVLGPETPAKKTPPIPNDLLLSTLEAVSPKPEVLQRYDNGFVTQTRQENGTYSVHFTLHPSAAEGRENATFELATGLPNPITVEVLNQRNNPIHQKLVAASQIANSASNVTAQITAANPHARSWDEIHNPKGSGPNQNWGADAVLGFFLGNISYRGRDSRFALECGQNNHCQTA